MRPILSSCALLLAFLVPPEAVAQPACGAVWVQVTSDRGSQVLAAQIIQTRTDRAGQTAVLIDGKRVPTRGPVWVIVREDVDRPKAMASDGDGASTGSTPALTFPTVTPPGTEPPLPIPYPSFLTPPSSGGSKVVVAPVDVGDATFPSMVGDEPPPAPGGILTRFPELSYLMFSFDVKVEGKNVVRLDDVMTTLDPTSGDETTTTTVPGGGGGCVPTPTLGN
ncbi:MAG: PAAR-like domain-containing protein [Bacteroidota bacterium]